MHETCSASDNETFEMLGVLNKWLQLLARDGAKECQVIRMLIV